MIPKRVIYAETRKYKSWQLKRLLLKIESNLLELDWLKLSQDQFQKTLTETKEMFFEIALRLD